MLFWDLKLSSRTWCTPSQGRNPAPMTRISAYSRRWFAASKMQIIISMLGEKNAAPWGSQHSIPSERQHGMRGFKCWNALQFIHLYLITGEGGTRAGEGEKRWIIAGRSECSQWISSFLQLKFSTAGRYGSWRDQYEQCAAPWDARVHHTRCHSAYLTAHVDTFPSSGAWRLAKDVRSERVLSSSMEGSNCRLQREKKTWTDPSSTPTPPTDSVTAEMEFAAVRITIAASNLMNKKYSKIIKLSKCRLCIRRDLCFFVG